MATLDMAVLLLIGGFGIRGFLAGFVMETLSLVAVIAGILAVRFFHAPVTEFIAPYLGTEYISAMLALLLLFSVVYISVKMLANTIGAQIRKSTLGPFDRVLGFGFGAVKGLLIAALCFLGFTIIYDALYGNLAPRPSWVRFARTYPLLNASSESISSWLAENAQQGGLLADFTGMGDKATKEAGSP